MAVVILAHTLQEVYNFSPNLRGGVGGSLVIMAGVSVWAVSLVLLFAGRMPRNGALRQ